MILIQLGCDNVKDLSFLKNNLIAHRGLHDNKYPENSIGAFIQAIKKNYIIELDIHLLKDNTIVVFHDDNLKRMTGINKKIKDYTYNELKDIKLLDTKYNIPTFDEVLKLIDGKVPLIVEFKYDRKTGDLEREAVKLLDNYKGLFCIKSFNPMTVRWFKKNRNNYIRGLLVDNKWGSKKEIISSSMILRFICKPDFLSCKYSIIDKRKVKKLSKKIPVLGWTIKSKTNYLKYKDKFYNLICENINEIL